MPARTPRSLTRCSLLLLVACATAGCRSLQRNGVANVVNPAAATLSPSPTFEQVAGLVNENSGRVQSLYAPQAQIRVPSQVGSAIAPKMQSIIAFERPDRIRLQGTVLGRSAVDVGVNDELAWMTSPGAVMYINRTDLKRGVAQDVLPLQPVWVADLFGLPEFSPDDLHSQPYAIGDGSYKITTQSPGQAGGLSRVVVFDAKRGIVIWQRIYAPGGQLAASAYFTNHYVDPTSGAILPGKIDVSWPHAGQEFEIELGPVEVNGGATQLASTLWQPPQTDGSQMINLADRGQIERYLASQP